LIVADEEERAALEQKRTWLENQEEVIDAELEKMRYELTNLTYAYGTRFLSFFDSKMSRVIAPGSKRADLSDTEETCAERYRRVNWKANRNYRDESGRMKEYERENDVLDDYRDGLQSRSGRNGEPTAYKRIPQRYNRMARDSGHKSKSINRDVSPDSRKHGTSLAMKKWWSACKRSTLSSGRRGGGRGREVVESPNPRRRRRSSRRDRRRSTKRKSTSKRTRNRQSRRSNR